MVEVASNEKHSILPFYKNNYGPKKCYGTALGDVVANILGA
jgi:hypothetical protein